MKTPPKTPAVERRRLERLRELAHAHRKTERALERAALAAFSRGISVRRVAAAIGWPTTVVWRRFVEPGRDAPGLDRADVTLPPRRATPAAAPDTGRAPGGHAKAAPNGAKPANRSTKPKASEE